MKTTTRIFDIVKGELLRSGHNEFLNKEHGAMKLTFNSPKFAFISKMRRYDDDVAKIINSLIFYEYQFPNKEFDYWFKKTFINRFLNREIGFQTVELFSSHVIEYCLEHEEYLVMLYENFENFATAKTISNSDVTGLNGYNNGYQDLPQDEVNLSLKSDTMNYATNNTINRGFDNHNSKGTNTSFSPENLKQLKGLYEDIFVELDNKCFLQVW